MDIIELAEQNQQNAWKLLDETGIIPAWERIGATVHLVGSLKSGLLMKSRDIDLHIYTGKLDITESFSVMQELAERLKLKESATLRCAATLRYATTLIFFGVRVLVPDMPLRQCSEIRITVLP